MEEQNNIPMELPRQSGWQPPRERCFPTGYRELILAAVLLVLGILLCNCIIFAGFNLGFALYALAILGAVTVYMVRSGQKPGGYSMTLLVLSAVIAASFPRSNDGFVKFVMICFLSAAVNIALILTAGKNRYDPAGVRTLLDWPIALFGLGVGKLDGSFRGLGVARKQLSGRSKSLGAVLGGLVIAVPVLAVMIPLLTSADAAFDGLLGLLPEFDFQEFFASVFLGAMVVPVLYTRSVALVHCQDGPAPAGERKKYMNSLTVTTVMVMVCVLYLAYLVSQLAYFAGGFSGILPEGYSMAQYARRGFFEMATLCGINLALMALAIGLVRKEPRAPLTLRLLCLFVGLVTLFMVAAASAKMGMYIGSYGLTRLRVLTEIIILFLGVSTALVCVWLFCPRLPYMKAVLVTALVMGAVVSWVDVDTVVAHYNVRAYQSGRLETVDVAYLSTLSDGAVPYLVELAEDPDPQVRNNARDWLSWRDSRVEDLRGWNYTTAQASKILKQFHVQDPGLDSQ